MNKIELDWQILYQKIFNDLYQCPLVILIEAC